MSVVTTSDGYILNIHRLPNPNATKTIFLQHGILASSWCWLSSSQYAPAVLLYRQGYEIFLGNNRGNIFTISVTPAPSNETIRGHKFRPI